MLQLQIYSETTMKEFVDKSRLLTGHLERLIWYYFGEDSATNESGVYIDIITPVDPDWRGCQLSLKCSMPVNNIAEELHKRGVVVNIV